MSLLITRHFLIHHHLRPSGEHMRHFPRFTSEESEALITQWFAPRSHGWKGVRARIEPLASDSHSSAPDHTQGPQGWSTGEWTSLCSAGRTSLVRESIQGLSLHSGSLLDTICSCKPASTPPPRLPLQAFTWALPAHNAPPSVSKPSHSFLKAPLGSGLFQLPCRLLTPSLTLASGFNSLRSWAWIE